MKQSDLFRIEIRELPPPPLPKGEWLDFIRIPWGLIVAIFYLSPKALIQELLGKETEGHHHHHEEGHGDPPKGWQPYILIDGVQFQRQYFYAEETFDDFYWNLVDGFQLRANPPIPGLESYYFLYDSFYMYQNGLIAQAINVEGEQQNCPLVYIHPTEKTVEKLCDLKEVYALKFEEKEGLMIKGTSSTRRFEIKLEENSKVND